MKTEIALIALENLQLTTGIQASWLDSSVLDGILKIATDGREYTFLAEVKSELRTHQLPQVEDTFKKHNNFLLLAKRLYPNIKEELRQRGIPYLEANGNTFLKSEGLLIWIETQKPLDLEKNKSNRAFTKTGLKVVFFLLQDKEAINLPQRELAAKAGVALGNIPQVIEGLKETGYLLSLNKKTYVWENRKALLEKWVSEYATLLRPKLRKDRYTFRGKWQDIVFDTMLTVWGAEPAADILTNHLRPEKLAIYTRENRMDLIRRYRLLPDNNGEIEVFEMFWIANKGVTAPPLLVYADLMLEGGKRNKETAEKIYHEYIQPNL